MLSKLLKYEYRATAIYFLPIYAMLIIVSCFSYIFRLLGKNANAALAGINTGKIYSTLLTLSISIYVLLAFALAITTVIVIIMRFYKNLLGNEGYLMFTLPVSVEKNILAKLIPAITWFVGSCILGIFTIVPAFFSECLPDLWKMFSEMTFGDFCAFLLFIICIIANLTMTFLFFYLCMCIGQLFNSHKFIASVATYIGIQGILQVIAIIAMIFLTSFFERNYSFIQKIVQFFEPFGLTGSLNFAFAVADIIVLLCCAGLLFLDSWILKRKLNLT